MQTITLTALVAFGLATPAMAAVPFPRNIKVFGQKHETARRTFKTYFRVS